MQEGKRACLLTVIRLVLDDAVSLSGDVSPLHLLFALLGDNSKAGEAAARLRSSARDSGILVKLVAHLRADDCSMINKVSPKSHHTCPGKAPKPERGSLPPDTGRTVCTATSPRGRSVSKGDKCVAFRWV